MQKDVGILPLPNCELFQVHGSKFKPHPIRYLGQACVSCVSHAMLFLGIRKDPFNGFLAHLVVSPVPLRIAELLCHIHIRLPDVLRYCLNEVLIPGTQRPGGTVRTDLWITFILPVAVMVGCGVFQYLVFRADDTVIVFIIHILPPFMSALHGLRPCVGGI